MRGNASSASSSRDILSQTGMGWLASTVECRGIVFFSIYAGVVGQRISLKQVALAAHVSVSTVSLVLSGDRRISALTRERVAEVAARLGYVRDPLLAGLASGRFRHTGKPVSIGVSIESDVWSAAFRDQALNLGMAVRVLDAPLAEISHQAVAEGVGALVICRRGFEVAQLEGLAVPIVLWEDESPIDIQFDVIETVDWWVATAGVIARVRAAGYERPAAILIPAQPWHWHDEMRAAACASGSVPTLVWDRTEAALINFLTTHRPDAIIGSIPHVHRNLRLIGVDLPFAGLMTFANEWYGDVTGWVADQAHRGQVTLELIEQRLRYGPRTPRRIVVAPRWQEGASLGRPR